MKPYAFENICQVSFMIVYPILSIYANNVYNTTNKRGLKIY